MAAMGRGHQPHMSSAQGPWATEQNPDGPTSQMGNRGPEPTDASGLVLAGSGWGSLCWTSPTSASSQGGIIPSETPVLASCTAGEPGGRGAGELGPRRPPLVHYLEGQANCLALKARPFWGLPLPSILAQPPGGPCPTPPAPGPASEEAFRG